MLKQLDELYKYLMIMLLAIYLINSIYLQEVTITFIAIILVIILELIKNRHHIKKLSNSLLAIIGIVLLAGITGIIYMLVMFQIFLDTFGLPQAFETGLIILFMLMGLYVLWYFLKKIFNHAVVK
ncbi:hypothetical protein MHB48_19760 [Psychrobacillus sp. FSL H8-0483]|uniref:hypothetical protein n=1 Tax=Psychrobacillus sp. FSL H8-0483 TaxID=2921389 RepID=UPI00315A0BEE